LYPLKKPFLNPSPVRVYSFYFFPFFSFATVFSLSSFSFPFFSLCSLFFLCSLFSLGFLVVDSVAWAWWFGLADLGVVVDSVAWALWFGLADLGVVVLADWVFC
jgi:hypothetical protein